MNVDIDDLEKSISVIFSHLRAAGKNSINIDKDFYWNIKSEQKYDPYQEPKDLSLGQLEDDWTEIEKIANGKAEAVGYALVWVASLCSYIGEKNPG